ncbi:hypothetical protein BN946_scf184830.g26 [Trametes cinnabarina]|uniref:Ketoreductase (KR) domain-containing protein n=1 Tax=Pycnoporus cinnabarinus TaxID=5643 RepID=A0A060SFH0_PYCCI|nr:hypothetical protein BN946_scf184830.g26 [Trametes cinnabarina]
MAESQGFPKQLVWFITATARSLEKLQSFSTYGDQVQLLQLDVTDGSECVKAKVKEAVHHFGCIDVLVNNAGTGEKSLIEEGGSGILRKQFDVSFFAVVDVTNAVLPHMRPHAASKAALRVLAETLNVELTPFGIRSLIVEPGGFRTNSLGLPWTEESLISDYDQLRETAKARFSGVSDSFRGDPAKAMELLVDVVRGEGQAVGKPWTLYLPMGDLADSAIRAKMKKVLEALDEWKDLGCQMNEDQ